MKTIRFGFLSLALSAAAISVLVQCAPKDSKKKDAPPGATTGQNDSSASLVAGIDFSALEKAEGYKSTQALLKALKEGSAPDAQILSMALVELHLKNGGKSKEAADKTLEVVGKVSKLAEAAKVQKPEELKKIYDLIEKDEDLKIKRNLRANPAATSILDVLSKGEIQEYSGTSLLTLAWLQTRSLVRAKGAVLIENGGLKLAEIRDGKNVIVIDSLRKGTLIQQLGNAEELVKGNTKRLVQLDLFVIHETLKNFASDSKAWALKVQKASNKALDLKIDEKQVAVNSSKVEKNHINQSELLMGTPSEPAIADLPTDETVEPASAPAKPQDPGTAQTVSGAAPSAEPAQPTSGAASPAASPAAVPAAPPSASNESTPAQPKEPGSVRQGEVCLSMEAFSKQFANKEKTLFRVFRQFFVSDEGDLMMDAGVPGAVFRLEGLDPVKLALDAELDKTVKMAQEEMKKDGKLQAVLLLKSEDGKSLIASLQIFEKESQKRISRIGNRQVLNKPVMDYLKAIGRAAKTADDKALWIELREETCS